MDFYEYEELLEEENRQTLQHYGRLKQKWGIRNGPPYPLDRSQLSPAEKRANPTVSEDAQPVAKKRSIKDLSNQELRDITERTRLENEFMRQKYDALRLAQGPQIQKGDSFIHKAANLSKDITTLAVNVNTISKVVTGKSISDRLLGKDAEDAKKTIDKAKDSDAMKEFEKRLNSFGEKLDASLNKSSGGDSSGDKKKPKFFKEEQDDDDFSGDKWLKKNIDKKSDSYFKDLGKMSTVSSSSEKEPAKKKDIFDADKWLNKNVEDRKVTWGDGKSPGEYIKELFNAGYDVSSFEKYLDAGRRDQAESFVKESVDTSTPISEIWDHDW